MALFKQRLSRASVLNFRHGDMVDNTFHFLDVYLTLTSNGTLATSVFIKPTDNGLYRNFNSHTPLTYKKSVVMSLIHRVLKYTSSWDNYNTEINRIKQLLANNNYPQHLVEIIIAQSLKNHLDNDSEPPDPTNTITLFV